jgi:uncharacterized protein YggT (Ycf19 family)
MQIALIVVRVLDLALSVLEWIIIVWVILSWIMLFLRSSKFRWRQRGLYGALERINAFCERVTLPLLRPIRRWLRRFNTGPLDLSPLVLLLSIMLVRKLLVELTLRFILVPVT